MDAQAVLRRKGELSGKLDWENANLREKNPRRRLKGRPALDKRQADVRRSAMGEFVAKHNLTCFKCNTVEAEWAKTGISKRGPWAICTECVTSG